MAWTIRVSNKAQKQIDSLDNTARKQVLNYLTRIEQLDNPRQLGKNLQGKYSHLWRYRTGNYRILCRIKDDEVIVDIIYVAHRRSVYKKLSLL